MNERVIDIVVIAVIGVQLAAPLALGLPQMLKKDRPPVLPSKRAQHRLMRKQQRAAAIENRSALVPLVCAQCRAPVPLEARSFACPFCAATVTPPADYVNAIDARDRAERELARAERVWRWSRVTSSRPVTWSARTAIVAWALAVLFACAVVSSFEIPLIRYVLWLAAILAFFEVIIGLSLVSVFAQWRTSVPPVPRARFLDLPAAQATCRGCRAPIAFAPQRLASTCGYCCADNYRAALAQEAGIVAREQAKVAHASLLEAVRARDERRSEIVTMFAALAIGELFYGALFGIAAVADFIGL